MTLVKERLAGLPGVGVRMPQTSPQTARFILVADLDALNQLFARSHQAPVVLFKHSLTCPISARAYKQMAQVTPDIAGEIAIVVVQQTRDVSREVEAQTGVRHESPQAIILRNGQAVWSVSHYEITAEAIERAVRENQ